MLSETNNIQRDKYYIACFPLYAKTKSEGWGSHDTGNGIMKEIKENRKEVENSAIE